MVTYTFTNGTIADATQVNQNFLDVENGGQVSVANTLDMLNANHNDFYINVFTAQNLTPTGFTFDSTDQGYTVVGTTASTLVDTARSKIKPLGGQFASIQNNWLYFPFTVYDEYNDSVVDTTKQTTVNGVSTEDTVRLQTSWTIPAATSGIMLRIDNNSHTNWTTNQSFFIRYLYGVTTHQNNNETMSFRIYGSTSGFVLLTQDTYANNATSTYILYLKVDWTNKLVTMYNKTTGVTSIIDISSLTGASYYFATFGQTTYTAAGTIIRTEMYYFREIKGTETTTQTIDASANNGTNYTTANAYGKSAITTLQRGVLMIPRFRSTPASATEGMFVYGLRYAGFNN
jgi:hypothetical protein